MIKMMLTRGKCLLRYTNIVTKINAESKLCTRTAMTKPSGAILPEPKKTPFGFIGVVCSVVIGLLIGAAISKNVANYLEENDLFVPSDDDDDD